MVMKCNSATKRNTTMNNADKIKYNEGDGTTIFDSRMQ